jgi:hypothetical protein
MPKPANRLRSPRAPTWQVETQSRSPGFETLIERHYARAERNAFTFVVRGSFISRLYSVD